MNKRRQQLEYARQMRELAPEVGLPNGADLFLALAYSAYNGEVSAEGRAAIGMLGVEGSEELMTRLKGLFGPPQSLDKR